MIEIPQNLKKVSVHFKMKGPPPTVYRYPGVELLEPTAEQEAARAKYAEEHRGELLFPLGSEKTGLKYGASMDALNQLKLVRATIEERWAEATEFRKASPYCWFTFSFVKTPYPQTQVLGEDTMRVFMKHFQSGWGEVRVYRNPVVKNGVPLDESALSIVLANPSAMPTTYELGDEIVFGVRRVINRNPKLERDGKPRPGISLPQTQ